MILRNPMRQTFLDFVLAKRFRHCGPSRLWPLLALVVAARVFAQTNVDSNSLPPGVAFKPNPGTAIQFVSPYGKDSNDGLSWGSSKLTIDAAITSLPGGSANPMTIGAGTV